MQAKASLGLAVLGAAAVLAAHCGGTTAPGGGADASIGEGGSSGSGSGSSSGGSSGGACSPSCAMGLACCGGQCVNTGNDPFNCGGCGTRCSGATPYCGGSCKAAPCEQEAGACANESCCGTQCCGPGQLCCQLEQGVWITQCHTLQNGETTCPVGCPQCVSDRNRKRSFEPVDPQSVLERVVRMPISTWSYKDDDPSVRHMGMMAQDFHDEFGLGTTDKAFDPVDAHGVEMAAIQALYERMREQEARIRRLERENAELRATKR